MIEPDGTKACEHDGVSGTVISDEKALERRLKTRQEIVSRHNAGTLPKSYYSTNDKGKPYLSPKKLFKQGY